MENLFAHMQEHRDLVASNIEKSFDNGFEKARSGVYEDNSQNRKLGRVGQTYGHTKEQEKNREEYRKMTPEEKKKVQQQIREDWRKEDGKKAEEALARKYGREYASDYESEEEYRQTPEYQNSRHKRTEPPKSGNGESKKPINIGERPKEPDRSGYKSDHEYRQSPEYQKFHSKWVGYLGRLAKERGKFFKEIEIGQRIVIDGKEYTKKSNSLFADEQGDKNSTSGSSWLGHKVESIIAKNGGDYRNKIKVLPPSDNPQKFKKEKPTRRPGAWN